MGSPVFVNGDAAGWEDAGPGVKRQVLTWSEGLMLVRVAFEDGAVGPPHSHPHLQSCYVESGVFEVTIGPETRLLRAGDSFTVPADVLHGVRAHAGGVLVDVFTPYREDFVRSASSGVGEPAHES